MADGANANTTQQSTTAAPAAGAATGPAGAGAAGAGQSILSTPPADQTKAGGAAGEQTQQTTTTQQTTAAPAELELKFADGVQVDKAFLDGFKPLAKDLGLDSPKAQKFADFLVGYQKSAGEQQAKAQTAAVEQLKQKYTDAAKADKEYGGANFDASVALARKALVRFGTPELQKALADHGMENHPELIRWAVRVGKAIAEDSVAGTQTTATGGKPSAEEVLKQTYPTMFPKG
jgi:hypothetical protein